MSGTPTPFLRARVLQSGSAGNAVLVEADRAALLVDAGMAPDALVRALETAGVSRLAAIVLTHEHDDHARAATVAARRFRAPIVATEGTLRALGMRPHDGIVERLPVGPRAQIGPFAVEAFPVPHDAAEPVGVHLRTAVARVLVALDVGEVTPDLTDRGAGADLIVLEANYDLRLLSAGPYPWFLKNRIVGGRGHLSNNKAAQAVAAMVTDGHSARSRGPLGHGAVQPDSRAFSSAREPHGVPQLIWLSHLSDTNNLAPLARDVVREALRREGRAGVAVEAIRPNAAGPVWERRAGAAGTPRRGIEHP